MTMPIAAFTEPSPNALIEHKPRHDPSIATTSAHATPTSNGVHHQRPSRRPATSAVGITPSSIAGFPRQDRTPKEPTDGDPDTLIV